MLFGQPDLNFLLDSNIIRKCPKAKNKSVQAISSNCHNSIIFKARNLKFCMEVHLDILLLDVTSNLTSDLTLTLTSSSEVKSLK